VLGYEVLKFKKEDHLALMTRWYEARKFPTVPDYLLPEIGLVVKHDGAYICLGHMYRTDGSIASISHLASSPVASSEERHIGLNMLISGLMDIANEQKFKMITIASNIEKLFERFEEFGFAKTDENVTHFGRYLWLGD